MRDSDAANKFNQRILTSSIETTWLSNESALELVLLWL